MVTYVMLHCVIRGFLDGHYEFGLHTNRWIFRDMNTPVDNIHHIEMVQ